MNDRYAGALTEEELRLAKMNISLGKKYDELHAIHKFQAGVIQDNNTKIDTLTKQNEILKSMLELIEENDFSESHICCAGYSELKAVAKSTRNSLQALKEIEKLDEK